MNKNTVLIGRGTIAVNCLNVLYKHQHLPKIIICDSKDKGKDTWTKSLLKRALELGFKEEKNLFKETKVNKPQFIQKLKATLPQIDIIFSVQPRAIFKKAFIGLAKDYVVNLHFAPLPKLRGVLPCSWAFLDGLKKMGVTLHLIQDEGIDNGPIIYQKLFPIKDTDNAWSLFNKCIKEGTRLFEENLDSILNNRISPIEQDEKEATYHRLGELDFSDLRVDLNKNIEEVFNFIRSRIFPPFQLPYFIYEDKKVFILNVLKKPLLKTYFRRKQRKIIFSKNNYLLLFPQGVLVVDKFKEERL